MFFLSGDHLMSHPTASFKTVDVSDRKQLKSLNEGEIVKGTNGKLYRARKTIYPSTIGGPHGLGDPESKTLSKVEEKLVIPELMGKQVHKFECRPEFTAFIHCLRSENSIVGPRKCKPYMKAYDDCKIMKFQDDTFLKKVTDDYLDERSKFREVGLNQKQRKFYEYLQWKAIQKSTQDNDPPIQSV